MSRSPLRTRLLVAFLAVSLGVLVVAGAMTFVLARRTAHETALHDLEQKAPEVATSLARLGRRLLVAPTQPSTNDRILLGALRISAGALVRVSGDGTVVQGLDALGIQAPTVRERVPAVASLLQLPAGVEPADLDTEALLAGEQVSGRRGDVVFVAQPLGAKDAIVADRGRLVVVLAEGVDPRPIGRAGPYFLLAGGAALLMTLGVSYLIARRLTRPLAAMETTARRIAGGDLTARVDVDATSDRELALLGASMNTMASELERARGMERSFLLSVSHDLRTPLTSIRGYSEAIADGTVTDDEARVRAAEIISSEARRLERLVADLLDLARLDSHQFSLRPQPVDVATVVRSAAQAFLPAAGELGIALRVGSDTEITATVDPERLGQIVANLVENAMKYAASSITVATSASGGTLSLRVDDDGPGIDPADLPHVFERLYTSRTTPGRKVGTGLGLAIVRELTAAMNGQVTAAPAPGRGTRFTVDLPIGASP
ncbi:MAG: HAMP domain-containing sensor histidine kinase [Acidimicrobiia bacterium]